MSETQTVGITERQREILLRGLRFVRSAIAMECRDATTDSDLERRQQLQEVSALVEQLNGKHRAGTPAAV